MGNALCEEIKRGYIRATLFACMYPQVMIALIAFAAISAAVDTRLTSPECRVIGQQIENTLCCESCESDLIMHTRWVTRQASVSAVVLDAELGSGGGVVDSVEVASVAESHVACGECVTVDRCMSSGGHVNTWHRTCSTR